MRKLLVASQKSGVGKTTTAIHLAAATAVAGARVLLVEADPLNNISSGLNLAQYPRRSLRGSGLDLPGVLCSGIVPGLDVFSPYEEGGCSDDDLDQVLQVVGSQAFQESYDCLIVNAPPFLGGQAGALLSGCEELVVVMQAEPMAFRTTPAFLEMIQRSVGKYSLTCQMRGILLTLPESEEPGGRWERELRGRFRTQLLPQAVPYDEEVPRAALFGQVSTHASPESPASLVYRELATELQLARDATGQESRSAEATLALAATTVRPRPPEPRIKTPAFGNKPVGKSSGRFRTVGGGNKSREKSPVATIPTDSPTRSNGEPRRSRPTLPKVAPEPDSPAPSVPASEPFSTPPPLHTSRQPWMIWIGLAIVAGIGLRFVQLPTFVLPLGVGIAVAAAVLLVLRVLGLEQEETSDRK